MATDAFLAATSLKPKEVQPVPPKVPKLKLVDLLKKNGRI